MTVKIQKLLTVIAVVVLTLLLVVSTAVPAFAAETATAQNNEQFEVVEPEYNSDANDYVTLPDAPANDGYTFKGWSVDGSTKLYDAGETIANNDGHKMQIQPVYEAIGAENEGREKAYANFRNLSVILFVIFIGCAALSFFCPDSSVPWDIVGGFALLLLLPVFYLYILALLAKP